MSRSVVIKLKKGKAKAPKGHGEYGNALPYMLKELDQAAKKLKVTAPSEFVFEDPEFYKEFFGEDLKGLPPTVAKRIATQKDWHEAAVGVKTFSKLLAHYRKTGGAAKAVEAVEAEDLIYELEAFKMVLEEAKKGEFRLMALV